MRATRLLLTARCLDFEEQREGGAESRGFFEGEEDFAFCGGVVRFVEQTREAVVNVGRILGIEI